VLITVAETPEYRGENAMNKAFASIKRGLQQAIRHGKGPADKDAKSAWNAEILRRLNEIDAGTAELVDREELRRRMRARRSIPPR